MPSSLRRLLPVLLACLLLAAGPASADDGDAKLEVKQTEILWELSPYYSSVAALIPLGNETQSLSNETMTESEVYSALLAKSASPTILLLEASVYPMPWLGTQMRRESPDSYADDDRKLKLIPALTAGFQEPWALSAFIGSDMVFVRPGQAVKESNRGYMGYLVSVGNRHIVNNWMVDDNWVELEWKMKGERIFNEDRLSWSFRVGGRFHENPGIGDTIYFGISRSNLDINAPLLSWLSNTKINVLTELLQNSGKFSRQEIIFGKKIPVKSAWMAAWQIEFGAIYDAERKYSGDLAPLAVNGTTLILRPNIEF